MGDRVKQQKDVFETYARGKIISLQSEIAVIQNQIDNANECIESWERAIEQKLIIELRLREAIHAGPLAIVEEMISRPDQDGHG